MSDANNNVGQSDTSPLPAIPAVAMVESKPSSMGSVAILFIVGVLVIGIAVWFKWFHVSGDDQSPHAAFHDGQRVIVIDTNKIVAAATKKVLASPTANATEEGAKLGAKLSAVMEEYRKSGVLILNGYTVTYCPPDLDKTAEVAEKVGVSLD